MADSAGFHLCLISLRFLRVGWSGYRISVRYGDNRDNATRAAVI